MGLSADARVCPPFSSSSPSSYLLLSAFSYDSPHREERAPHKQQACEVGRVRESLWKPHRRKRNHLGEGVCKGSISGCRLSSFSLSVVYVVQWLTDLPCVAYGVGLGQLVVEWTFRAISHTLVGWAGLGWAGLGCQTGEAVERVRVFAPTRSSFVVMAGW